MHPIVAFARSKRTEIIQLIQEFVECESPSDNPAAVNRFVALAADRLAGMGRIRTFPGGRFGRHFRCEFDLPGPARKSNEGIILALGHSDTVWPMGTLARMPFRQEKGRLWGPGVLDMKSGLVFFIYAMRALREMNLPVRRRVVLQVNADEEVGSESSRPLTEEAGRRAAAVLVLEPGTGLDGKLKTSRKGVGDYTVTVQGRASHAGVDWEAGASAILELARQIDRIAGFTDLTRGVTVNPGVISGGTRTNVVAERASAGVDIRIARAKDEAALDHKFRSLKPIDKRCTIQLEGGLNRPPMERSAAIRQLFATAQPLASKIGIDLRESSTGGGSDGNFTAAIGIPTLDGLGGVGEGAHASHESILVNRIADRTALLALLVSELGQ